MFLTMVLGDIPIALTQVTNLINFPVLYVISTAMNMMEHGYRWCSDGYKIIRHASGRIHTPESAIFLGGAILVLYSLVA